MITNAPTLPTVQPPSGVLERGLLLLSLFTMDRNRLFLRDFAELSGLDKSTCLRSLRTLSSWGFLEKGLDGSYSPGPANLRLAAIFRVSSSLLARLTGPIERISQKAQQTTAFFVRSEDQRICLARSRATYKHTHFVDVGVPIPLADGGSAATILRACADPSPGFDSPLPIIGYAVSRGERLKHYASVSVPVFEMDRTFLGAITISGLSVELPDEVLVICAAMAQAELTMAGFVTTGDATLAGARLR